MSQDSQRSNVVPLPQRDDTTAASSLANIPLMLSVSEAAAVLRISRTTAYKLVELHRRTDGHDGLPHVRLGGRVLVRRVDLAAIVGLPTDAA